jgi:helicase
MVSTAVPGVVEKVLAASGFSKLNPVQEAALDAGLLSGKNMVLAAATASGKTLVAEMAMLSCLGRRKKTLYIVPLKALASEKYNEFKEKYGKSGVKVALSVGDRDSSDAWLAGYDVIIATSEKLDSIMRHGADWLSLVGLVVADEVHLIDSPNRGPTLEVTLTRLMHLISPQVLALSATIRNYKDLAGWLSATAVKSDFRPVKLYCGVFSGNEVSWNPKKEKLVLPGDLPPVFEIARDTVRKGKQALVFVSSRKSAESLAEKIGDALRQEIGPADKAKLTKLSYDVSNVLDHPTAQCRKLGECLQKGAVFHHAGLVAGQRKFVEDAFRQGLIKVICATPTLAAGVNLPAYRVIVKDMRRFESFRGMDYIPVLEIQQMMGRAGRPQYDTEGEAILIAGTEMEAKKLWNMYITGEPEDIVSKLGMEPVLRTHVLSLIATGGASTREELMDFFRKTFYAHQYRDMTAFEREMGKVLATLRQYGFVEDARGKDADAGVPGGFVRASSLSSAGKEELRATKVGKRVAELYIDPLSANHMIKGLSKMREEKKESELSVLHVLSGCLEMKPGLSIRKRDTDGRKDGEGETLSSFMVQNNGHLVGRIPTEWELDYEDFMRGLKLARLLSEWIEEKGEDSILEDFGVTPGELRARIEISDWLFYSMQELCMLLSMQDMATAVRRARIRVKYGIRQELLPLVKLRGIGRVRARSLFNNGYRTLEGLRAAPLTSLANILGPGIAKDVQRQLSGPVSVDDKWQQESVRDALDE